MKPVKREDLLDYVTYSERREALRVPVMAAKAARRIHVGEHLTFLFENTLTLRYQIQEMMRVERLVREEDIRHEIETYNELLPARGELACTLLVEIEDAAERDRALRRWTDLPATIYARLDDGRRIAPRADQRQASRERISSVQYLKFDTGGAVPVALGTSLEDIRAEAVLSDEQRAALREDLAS